MKRKKAVLICALGLLVYAGSYCCVRVSKQLVHQEVALVNTTSITHDGQGVCYVIHHDIGRGSFTDADNYNTIRPPSAAARIGQLCYYPLVKLELSYWQLARPQYIYESVCSE